MPKQIDQDKCIRCGTCQSECPNGGIAEVDGDYQIDAGLCTDCFGFYEQSHCMTSGILEGGLFVLREGNNLAPETPLENTEAMYEVGRELGDLARMEPG